MPHVADEGGPGDQGSGACGIDGPVGPAERTGFGERPGGGGEADHRQRRAPDVEP